MTPLDPSSLEPQTYTLKEAAQLTRMSRWAVRDAILAGRIAGIKPGGRWLVLKGPLDRLLRGEAECGAPP
jgi:excisionase family DNA binding protein